MGIERARELALDYGWNATSFQIVNPGIDRWFSARGDAVVGYVRRPGFRVVAGSPVCSPDRLAAVVEEWETESRHHGDEICYFGAAARLHALIGESADHSTVVLGAQPVWEPDRWPEAIDAHASLRAQFHRALNKGVSVSEWPYGRAERNPELHRCLEEWLETRGLPSLHFLVEPETLGNLQGRRVFVAERSGRAVGFVVASPAPLRRGWLTEQFVRGREAPNGAIELLIDRAVRTLARDGAEYITMGLVPLAEIPGLSPKPNPAWMRVLLAWVRAHGRRFYNFEGLAAFKAKFRPDGWEPIYAISSERRFSPLCLYAIASAFTGGSVTWALLRGLGRALRQEARWGIDRAYALASPLNALHS
jgi:phosphatidylglycerol lysyltransferase